MPASGFAAFDDRAAMLRFVARVAGDPVLRGIRAEPSGARPVVVLDGMNHQQAERVERLAREEGRWFPDVRMDPFAG